MFTFEPPMHRLILPFSRAEIYSDAHSSLSRAILFFKHSGFFLVFIFSVALFTQPFNKDSLSPRSIPGILLVLETKTQVRPVSTLKELPVWKGRQTYTLKITMDASKCYGNPNQFLYYVSESELT